MTAPVFTCSISASNLRTVRSGSEWYLSCLASSSLARLTVPSGKRSLDTGLKELKSGPSPTLANALKSDGPS